MTGQQGESMSWEGKERGWRVILWPWQKAEPSLVGWVKEGEGGAVEQHDLGLK